MGLMATRIYVERSLCSYFRLQRYSKAVRYANFYAEKFLHLRLASLTIAFGRM